MANVVKKIFSLVVLLSAAASTLQASTPSVSAIGPVTPYIAYRSQGYDAADELVGWTQDINQPDKDCNYFSFYVKPKYTRSFRSNAICNCLFGTSLISTNSLNNGCNTNCNTGCNGCALKVSGSRVTNRGEADLLADYFYLPTDFQSTLNFNPRIENVLVDFNFYWGLDSWVEGMFFRLHVPVTWTRWNLNFCETITNAGTASVLDPAGDVTTVNGGYAPGYFSFSAIPTQKLLTSFASYASGNAPAPFVDPIAAAGPITFAPLNFAQITNCARTAAGVADLAAILGYNFINCDDYHLGVGLYTSAPTGNRPQAQFLFEPIMGNGKAWSLGAHITSHANLWRSCDEESSVGFYLDCNIIHLFKARQRRTFDLVASDGTNKPLSRYMLAEKLGLPITNNLSGDGAPNPGPVPPVGSPSGTAVAVTGGEFKNAYTPVANFTTQDVKVSVGVQGDLAAQFTYTNCGFSWDLGYNFWGRSCEKICQTNCPTICPTDCITTASPIAFTENTWALKGDASVYGVGTGVNVGGDPIPLSATQTSDDFADITGGANFFGSRVVGINAPLVAGGGATNPQIDNGQVAYAGTPLSVVAVVDSTPALPINTSVQPIFITAANIANCRGTRAISNKIYSHLNYEWTECDWTPFFGIGGFAEFGPNGGNCNTNCNTVSNTTANCNTNCNSCLNCAISQWGVWAKFGVTFN